MADEWYLRVHPAQGLNWASVAQTATVHLPPGLNLMLFILYVEREQSEASYTEIADLALKMRQDRADPPAEVIERLFTARYSLRRWALTADAIFEEWDRYAERSRLQRIRSRWLQTECLERTGREAERAMRKSMLRRTNELLADAYSYASGEQGELLAENHTEQACNEMLAEFRRTWA